MRQCKKCGRTWVSQADWCIYCGSRDIIWEINEQKKQEDGE